MLTEAEVQALLIRAERALLQNNFGGRVSPKAFDSLYASGASSVYYQHGFVNGLKEVLMQAKRTVGGEDRWV